MLKAGDLRYHRITIQKSITTKDSQGSDIQDWETIYEDVPAKKVPLSANQFMAAQSQQSQIKGRFIIRSRSGLEGSDRVIEDGKAYDIFGWLPDPESGNEYITAPYGTGVNNGGF